MFRYLSKKSFDFEASQAEQNEKQLCIVGETGRGSFGRKSSEKYGENVHRWAKSF